MSDTEIALLMDRFMRRIHMSLQAKAHAFDTENIGPGGGMVLLTLADTGPVGMQELTRRVVRDKSQMTRMVRSLETKGLMRRDGSEDDARVSIVSLTPKGDEVVAALKSVVAETISEILGPLSDAERSAMATLLARVPI